MSEQRAQSQPIATHLRSPNVASHALACSRRTDVERPGADVAWGMHRMQSQTRIGAGHLSSAINAHELSAAHACTGTAQTEADPLRPPATHSPCAQIQRHCECGAPPVSPATSASNEQLAWKVSAKPAAALACDVAPVATIVGACAIEAD